MARGLNKAQIIGNLGSDPDVKKKDDRIVARLSVATSRSWKDKQGNKVEHTEWHRIVLFGSLAEIAEKYLKKGDKAYFEGYLKTGKYTDKDGIERFATDIVAERLEMLGSPGGKDKSATNPYGQQEDGYARADQQYAEVEQYEDDIPF